MIENICMSSELNNKNLEPLFENISFPVTKADIIHEAELKGVSRKLLNILKSIPSRFYYSESELINQYIIKAVWKQRSVY